jgi:hypothetical protein
MPAPSAATVAVAATVSHVAAAVVVKATVAARKAATVARAMSARVRNSVMVSAAMIVVLCAILWAKVATSPALSALVAAALQALVHTATRCVAQADKSRCGFS